MRVMASPRPNQENPMSKATITHTQDDVDRAERRRTKRILDVRNIGVFIEEDTPLDEMPEIDQITRLRMLATKHRRPIGHLDLTDRAAVNRELDRLQMLEGGTRRRGSYRTIRVAPTPSNLSTAEMRQRAAESRRTRDARYAGGRFVETSGYGSHASYSVQTAEARSMGAENLVREATEGQVDYIRSLSQLKRIPVQIPTRFDLAQELLDELIAAQPAPSARQAQYLADLQRKLGLEQKPAATAEEARAELDRLIAIRNGQQS
jgi:hypothetical protein